METVRKRVLADGNWRVRTCCCCDLKTGTTVIGVLDIIFNILIISIPSIESDEEAAKDEDSVVKTIQGRTIASWTILCIIRVLCLILVAAMLYGNWKGNAKFMTPYLHVVFIFLVIEMLFTCTAALAYIVLGEFLRGFGILLRDLLVMYVFPVYFWHVIRCRTLEIDELDQPGQVYDQRDPELPAYGDVQGVYGNAQSGYSNMQGGYANDQGGYGDVKGAYSDVQGSYEKSGMEPPAYSNEGVNQSTAIQY